MNRVPGPTAISNPATGDGHDPGFLAITLPMPQAASERELVRLDYVHFSVLLDPHRRLGALTAVNIDGGSLVDVARDDAWHLDPRVPPELQAGPELYTNNDLDRGHLVRRRDPVWGAPEVAHWANTSTFAYTNAAPQMAIFNQSKELWSGLEDYVLEHARVHELRLTVYTGCVFATDDPLYRGIQIPLRFWKVAMWVAPDRSLAATGYVLDQAPELSDLELDEAHRLAAQNESTPPLGPFRTFQVPIRDIEELTGLDLGPVTPADQLVAQTLQPGGQTRWVEIEQYEDIFL